MKTHELKRLQKLLSAELKEQRLKPVPLPKDAKETIINNWGSVVNAANSVGVDWRNLYRWLKQGSVPNKHSLPVSFLLSNTLENAATKTED